VNPDFIESIPC